MPQHAELYYTAKPLEQDPLVHFIFYGKYIVCEKENV